MIKRKWRTAKSPHLAGSLLPVTSSARGFHRSCCRFTVANSALERVARLELALAAWKAAALPLGYTRKYVPTFCCQDALLERWSASPSAAIRRRRDTRCHWRLSIYSGATLGELRPFLRVRCRSHVRPIKNRLCARLWTRTRSHTTATGFTSLRQGHVPSG